MQITVIEVGYVNAWYGALTYTYWNATVKAEILWIDFPDTWSLLRIEASKNFPKNYFARYEPAYIGTLLETELVLTAPLASELILIASAIIQIENTLTTLKQ